MKKLTPIAALIGATMAGQGMAQTSPTQTAYRCEQGGKVIYTDQPCLNGVEIDTTPTKGLNKSTGTTLKGQDVQREERDEGLSKALAPLIGGRDIAVMRRRQRLSQMQQRECERMDSQHKAGTSPEETLAIRKRYKELGC